MFPPTNSHWLSVDRLTYPTHSALRLCSQTLPSTNLLRRHLYSKVHHTSTVNANSLVNIGSVSLRNSLFAASVATGSKWSLCSLLAAPKLFRVDSLLPPHALGSTEPQNARTTSFVLNFRLQPKRLKMRPCERSSTTSVFR